MDILMIGRWVLLIIGSIAVIVAIVLTALKADPFRRLLLIWIFGVLLVGLGVFGLEFMPQYREWLNSLTNLVNNPGQESYKEFLTKAGNDELPATVQKIGINYAVNNPIQDLEKILDQAINNAPEGKTGKTELKEGLKTLKEKQNVVDQLLMTKPNPALVKKFDPATAELFYQKLTTLPETELRQLDINPEQLKLFKPN
jgi:hypothetical protein